MTDVIQEQSLPADASLVGADKVRVVKADGTSVIMLASDVKDFMGGGTAIQFIEVVNVGDDKGLISTEQFSVGQPGNGKETVLGSGDSYGVGKEDTTPDGDPVAGSAWHCDIADTTGLTITNATDVTVEMSSDSGSTSPLFNGTGAGKYILVGSEYKFGGAKAKVDTVGVIEPDNVAGEYLATTAGWVTAPFMATESGYPYTQLGNQLATTGSEQWRFGFHPASLPITWDKVTLNINGTAYTKYWARFRVTDTISTDPIMQQLKLHTDRFEINADGNTEYFGRSRYERDLSITKHTNASKNPANENLQISSDINVVEIDNEFANGAIDGVILTAPIPVGLDTSIPVRVDVMWYPKGTNTGDVELELDIVKMTPGVVLDGTIPVSESVSSVSTASGTANLLTKSSFYFDVSDMLPGQGIIASLFRDASGANPDDTFTQSVVIVNQRMVGYFWRP